MINEIRIHAQKPFSALVAHVHGREGTSPVFDLKIDSSIISNPEEGAKHRARLANMAANG